MAKEYRTRNRIILDVLKSVKEGRPATITVLLHATNLPTDRLQGYLDELVGRGLIEARVEDGRRSFLLSPAGQQFLAELDRVDRFMTNFGMRL